MAVSARPARYSAIAIGLHWLIAALIVGQLAGGLYMDTVEGLAKFELIQLHKSVGITILLLSLARLAWRLLHPPPPYAADVPRWQRVVATATHWGFYGLMIGLPLTGWALVSASPYNLPTLLYDVVPWPHLPGLAGLPAEEKKAVSGAFGTAHWLLTRLTFALLALHIAAALKHHLVDRDETLWRMLPLVRPRANPVAGA